MKGLLERFIPEARDLIDSSSNGLLRLEKAPDDVEAVNEVFRAVHTLKGSSGLFDVPALTRLVHAAEDLLGAVRSEEMSIDSDLVDQLLAALDQVGTWIDHLEDDAHLPENADRISSTMVSALRRAFDARDAATSASSDTAAATAAKQPEARRPVARERLDVFSTAERFAAFVHAAEGAPLVHVRYTPAEDCFFNGTDPLQLVLAAPGLVAAAIEPVTPFAPVAELDPYRCNLAFDALCAAGEDVVDHHFCYELDRVAVAPVDLADLVVVEGRPSDNPVFEDFRDDAGALLAAGDRGAIVARAHMLIDTMGADLAAVSALRWLAALSAGTDPDVRLLEGLLAAVPTGRFTRAAAVVALHPTSAATPTPVVQVVLPEAGRHRALDIVATQSRRLAGRPWNPRSVVGVGTIVRNLAEALGDDEIARRIEAAVTASEELSDAAPLVAALAAIHDRLSGVAASRHRKPRSKRHRNGRRPRSRVRSTHRRRPRSPSPSPRPTPSATPRAPSRSIRRRSTR
jgi:two-component system chemotaxis sensor kinase CheA